MRPKSGKPPQEIYELSDRGAGLAQIHYINHPSSLHHETSSLRTTMFYKFFLYTAVLCLLAVFVSAEVEKRQGKQRDNVHMSISHLTLTLDSHRRLNI